MSIQACKTQPVIVGQQCRWSADNVGHHFDIILSADVRLCVRVPTLSANIVGRQNDADIVGRHVVALSNIFPVN